MSYATTVCSTWVVRVGLCVRSFGRGFLPMYDPREVSTVRIKLWDRNHIIEWNGTSYKLQVKLRSKIKFNAYKTSYKLQSKNYRKLGSK